MPNLDIDLARLDEDPLLREQVVGVLRLLHSDFPAGLRHPINDDYERPRDGVGRNAGDCLMCAFLWAGFFQEVNSARHNPQGHSLPYRIHPDFAAFIHGTEDQDYVNAIRAWVAMQGIMDETATD